MRIFIYLIAIPAILLLVSCSKNEDITSLNYSMNCDKDSSFYYYTIDYERIFLDVSTLCVTIKFSDTTSDEFIKKLHVKNPELDSVSTLNEEDNLFYGYLRKNCDCDEIKALLEKLNKEDQILCANPNFVTKESISRGFTTDNKRALMGLSDEFIIKPKSSTSSEYIHTLLLMTNTRLVHQKEFYWVVSADKYSKGNSLEMSQYFYETGNFEFSHPNFYQTPVFF